MKVLKIFLYIFVICVIINSCVPDNSIEFTSEKAILIFPADNQNDVNVPIVFSWKVINYKNDSLTYNLLLSDDTLYNEWKIYSSSKESLELLEEYFLPLTTYYWKVEVLNTKTNLKTASAIQSFKTVAFEIEEEQIERAQLISPINNAENITQPVSFLWELDSYDNLHPSYTLYITTDTMSSESWICYETLDNYYCIDDTLLNNTKYYWKVETVSLGQRSSISDVFSFTTKNVESVKTHYVDGEILQLQTAKKGEGVNIVILGDGFIKDDLIIDGYYYKSAVRAMEAFFLAEPYLSYRDYFNFYTVFAESNQRGADHETLSSGLKDTKFNTSYDSSSISSTYMTVNNNLCWEYSKKVPGCENIDKTLVVVMVNASRIAGYCHFWIQGRAIAICPITPKGAPWNQQFENLILHEAGGHGFSKLGDEYIKYPNQSINNSDATAKSYKSTLLTGINAGMFANIDITNDPNKVKWKDLYTRYPAQYKYVRSVEGAFYYGKDVFRPEPNSCMINNIKYYNAPSRLSIVKRIKFLSGESFSLDEFVEKDKLLNFPPQNVVD